MPPTKKSSAPAISAKKPGSAAETTTQQEVGSVSESTHRLAPLEVFPESPSHPTHSHPGARRGECARWCCIVADYEADFVIETPADRADLLLVAQHGTLCKSRALEVRGVAAGSEATSVYVHLASPYIYGNYAEETFPNPRLRQELIAIEQDRMDPAPVYLIPSEGRRLGRQLERLSDHVDRFTAADEDVPRLVPRAGQCLTADGAYHHVVAGVPRGESRIGVETDRGELLDIRLREAEALQLAAALCALADIADGHDRLASGRSS